MNRYHAATLAAVLALAAGCGPGEEGTGAPAPAAAAADPLDRLCPEHGVAERICPWCRPAAIRELGMCDGHGVPEAWCSRCNPALEKGFRFVKDWCEEHGLPESQCLTCHPELASNREAGPDSGAGTPPPAGGVSIETAEVSRTLRAPSVDCLTEALRVRFASEGIADAAGLEYAVAERRPVSRTLEALAEVAFVGDRHARLAAPAAATVEEVRRDLGDAVPAGEVLAVLRCADLGAAKAALLERRLAVESARERVAIAERLARTELRLAAVEFLRARDLLEVARRGLDREEDLLRRGAGTEKDALDARAALATAEADHRALRRKLLLFGVPQERVDRLTESGVESLEGRGVEAEKERLGATEALRAAEAGLAEASGRLRALGLPEGAIESVSRAGDTSPLLELRAPFAGTVVARNAAPGEVVDPSTPLFEVADPSRMWAHLDLREADARHAAAGLPVVVTAEALPGLPFAGKLTFVSPRVDPRTRTVRARATVENPEGLLREGMFGRAVVTVAAGEPRLVLPRDAVQWEGCCNVVFVRRSTTLFEPRKVRVGFEAGRSVVIEEGVAEGETVVTTGSFLLKTEILKGSIGAGCCDAVESR